MAEHWIWSNRQGAWLGRDRRIVPYVTLLHDAGRFAEGIARKMVHFGNLELSPKEWPDLVMIEVTNDYLFPEGKQLVAEFVQTGDRKALDEAFFRARDETLVNSAEFQESFAQLLSGEGREIEPAEFGATA